MWKKITEIMVVIMGTMKMTAHDAFKTWSCCKTDFN